MKLATDNKINASNTWNFALIDYFHDMSLLRSDSGDGSINFQKASCTLDGCVKVWTSRVDSVVVETGRLLHGLQDERAKRSNTRGDGEDDDDNLNDDEEGGHKKKRKATKESTLVKDFKQIALKSFDLEFSVDPLFKKTSADFDEGGAGGLLMNHLGLDSQMRIVFDAGDAPGVPDDAPAARDVEADESGGGNPISAPVEVDAIDMTKLASKLLGTDSVSGAAERNTALADLLGPRTLCPTFAPFRFSSDDQTLFEDLVEEHSKDCVPATAPTWTQTDYDDMPPLEDAPDMDGDADLFEDAALAEAALPALPPLDDDLDMVDGFDSHLGDRTASVARRGGQDVYAALGDFRRDGEQGDALFDLFDAQLAKNWAGPEHWKARRLLGDKDKVAAKEKEKDPANKRAKKQPLIIDFDDPEGEVDAKTLFAPPASRTGAGGITLPRPRKGHDQGASQFMLPPDTHFNSRQLLRLFNKPRMLLNIRRRGAAGGGAELMADESLGGHLETDMGETFWAEAQAARDGAGDVDYDMGGNQDEPADFGDNGFDDLDDTPALDEGFERPVSFGSAEEEDWDEAQLARERQARLPTTINYAKKAKRIDVRRLKENIWRGLDTKGASAQEQGEEEDLKQLAKPQTPRRMDNILAGLKNQYGQEQLEEISTSFCFICLLHLANEEGLTVNHATIVDDDDDEGAPDPDAEGFVGALGQLKIARDPTAGRGA